MLRAHIHIVAVAEEISAQRAVVAGDETAVHARRLELKEARDRRQKPSDDALRDRLAQFGHGDDHVVAALQAMIDDGCRLAVAIEEKAQIVAADRVIELHQQVAERKVQDSGHDQDRRAHRDAGGVIDGGEPAQHARHQGAWPRG